MTVAPKAAHGTIIEVQTDDSPLTWEAIDGVQNGPTGPSFTPQFLSTRHHGSEHTLQQVSTVEKGPVSFDILYDSNDTIHDMLKDAAKAGTSLIFRETLQDTGGEIYVYTAYVTFTPNSPVEGWVTANIQLTIDGDVTVS